MGNDRILDDPGPIVQMANELCATDLPVPLEATNQRAEPIMVESRVLARALRGSCTSPGRLEPGIIPKEVLGTTVIDRHHAAMARTDQSPPVALMLDDRLLTPEATFFDYECGRGGDLQRLAALGYDVAGWDPAYRPDGELRPADIVNLGFFINVIEDPTERAQALAHAWALTRKVLVVAFRSDWEARSVSGHPYGDDFYG